MCPFFEGVTLLVALFLKPFLERAVDSLVSISNHGQIQWIYLRYDSLYLLIFSSDITSLLRKARRTWFSHSINREICKTMQQPIPRRCSSDGWRIHFHYVYQKNHPVVGIVWPQSYTQHPDILCRLVLFQRVIIVKRDSANPVYVSNNRTLIDGDIDNMTPSSSERADALLRRISLSRKRDVHLY
jgi:hypothetical protein